MLGMSRRERRTILLAGVFVLASSTAFGAAVTFTANGPDPASIQTTVDAYRTALGALNPNVVGSFPSGRREINWDGVPDASSAPNPLPANFFNVNSPRGVVFSTPGTGFQVSATLASGTPVEFGNINPTYTATFQTFSAQRLFTALGSTVVDINFFVPGSAVPATTSGFGAVFTDVDLATTTFIEFFSESNAGLGSFFVPASFNGGLSFLGVSFNAGERIGRVRITSGAAALMAGVNDSPATDVVAMDDFIYAEPQGVGTPTPTATPTTPPPTTVTSTPTATPTPTTPPPTTVTSTPTATPTPTTPPPTTGTATPTATPPPPTVTTAPPTATATGTPTATTATPTATATGTPTATTATPTASPTAIASSTPTTTPTVIGGGGAPGSEAVPTLSPGILALLGVMLAAAALLLIRRA
jgi:hypothetical protein